MQRAECRPIVVNRIAVRVLSRRDVERRTRTRDHERAEAELHRHGNAATEKNSVTNVKRRAAVVLRDVVLIRGKARYYRTRRIAVGVAQRVVAEERKFLPDAHAAVHDELILLKNTGAFVLINIFECSEWSLRYVFGVKGRANGRIDISREERMNAAGIQIRERDIRAFRELAFQRHAGLHCVRNFEISIDLIDRGRILRRRKIGRSRKVGIKIRISHDKLLLRRSVQSLRLQQEILPKAIVKNSPARAKYSFRLAFFTGVDAPGDAYARRDVSVEADFVLRFDAQSVRERNVRANLPFVLCVKSPVQKRILRGGLAGHDGKLRRPQSGLRADLRGGHAACNSLLHGLVDLQPGKLSAV